MKEDKEILKEELKAYIEILKILSAFVITLGGGLATILISLDSPIKVLLFLIGSILELFFTIACLRIGLEISSLIRRLKD